MLFKSQQTSKPHQVELYDIIKSGNHVICLGPEQTKNYLFLSLIKIRSHNLHSIYTRNKSKVSILIIVPDEEHAKCREKLLANHTDLSIVNLFKSNSSLLPEHQVILAPINHEIVISHMQSLNIATIVFDHAEVILKNYGTSIISDMMKKAPACDVLALMCSLIDNDNEILLGQSQNLIQNLETLFNAKCETSSDLRSICRQAVFNSNFSFVECEPTQLAFCDTSVLSGQLFWDFCEFILKIDLSLANQSNSTDNDENFKFHSDSHENISKYSFLSEQKQALIVQSCVSDIIYSEHHLGLWCTKKTIKLYLKEFCRILNLCPVNSLISAASNLLQCSYNRLQDILYNYTNKVDVEPDKDVRQLYGISPQLSSLLNLLIEQDKRNFVVHVKRPVIAKTIALWLDKLSMKIEKYQFIKANYIVGSARQFRNKSAVDNFDFHHETAVRDFRFGNCNVLITAASYQKGIEIPRSNSVISFDVPTSFSDFIHAKGSCRSEMSRYTLIVPPYDDHSKQNLLNFFEMEKLLSHANQNSNCISDSDFDEVDLLSQLEKDFPPYLSSSKNPATLLRATGIINKYCTKLPSDSFTKLSPEWIFKRVESTGQIYCEVRLPINSPVRQSIIGHPTLTKSLAQKITAYIACKVLHQAKELDDDMLPVTKESMKPLSSFLSRNTQNSDANNTAGQVRKGGRCIGSNRHRQYYNKRVASVFSGPLPSSGIKLYLYKFNMVLVCPISDEQNRRGRRIVDPRETSRNFAIVCSQKLPKICPFPLFTRSGEVRILLQLVNQEFELNDLQIDHLHKFHEFTFSKVLRLEKYPIRFDPKKSPFAVLLAPVVEVGSSTSIDWEFVGKIVKSDKHASIPSIDERMAFTFDYEKYSDAVVIPWYRITDCQEFAYYVAQIRDDLNAKSPFPDEDTDYTSFIEYYREKYGIEIYHQDHPILDVDHTSARLNLLTPRYVNRKGVTLPSSTAKTRKESRESLAQKQLLIPELCAIHSFPASLWRKAVCLPSIFHRLNSLFLAEELRRTVAKSTGVGFVEPPENYEWKPLDFGWSSRASTRQIQNQNEKLDKDLESEVDEQLSSISYCNWFSRDKIEPRICELFVPSHRFLNKQTQQPKHLKDLLKIFNLNDLSSSLLPSSSEELDKVWYRRLCEIDRNLRESLVTNPSLFDSSAILKETELAHQNPVFGELLPDHDSRKKLEQESESWTNMRFDPTISEITTIGPSPSIILHALTMSNASDGINLERLETVGDSFLKYSITAYLYCMYPTLHEGKLSYLRSMEISNKNLYDLGKSKNLGELMSATKFEPNDNWLAPGYFIDRNQCPRDDSDDCNKKREINKALAEVPYDLLMQHSIPDKSIADCVEALIGAYLTDSGSRAALLFMQWLGLKVIPPSMEMQTSCKHKGTNSDANEMWRWLELPASPLIALPPIGQVDDKSLLDPTKITEMSKQELDIHYFGGQLDEFERKIGYIFKDKAYLVQAFSHNSCYENHITNCHQRLEFLGDALLDYLITRYLFQDPRCHSPGTLTDLRSALVNNTFFASLAVKYSFHKYLKYISDELFYVINGFVQKFHSDSEMTTKGYTLLITEGESEYAEDIEVPKALGDVFESVAGAIYLDSGMSLDTVWRVYFQMMKPEIEYFSTHVPKSPIRELLESMPQNVRFSPSELAPDRKHRVIAEVFGLGRFIGVGRNKHSAKCTAAKRALRALKSRQSNLNESSVSGKTCIENNENLEENKTTVGAGTGSGKEGTGSGWDEEPKNLFSLDDVNFDYQEDNDDLDSEYDMEDLNNVDIFFSSADKKYYEFGR